jgi:hypothetical protein
MDTSIVTDPYNAPIVTNSICGTTIGGDVHINGNGASLPIGSANPLLCAGNKFGGRVVIGQNTNTTAGVR